jgi:hypothetical protein
MPNSVKCAHCGSLFGIEGDDGVLRIKFKDLYREIEGRVSGPCRKCAMTVVWPDEDTIFIAQAGKEDVNGKH